MSNDRLNNDEFDALLNYAYRLLSKERLPHPAYRAVGVSIGGKVVPFGTASALRGDDRPAPNSDEWAKEMRRLTGEAST